MSKKNKNEEVHNYEFEPLVEVLKYSQLKNKDVVILRCEEGKENEEIIKMHSKLKTLLIEKDLRILAVNPDFDMSSLRIAIESAKNFQEEYFEEELNKE
jgi:hypothetical protein